VDLSPEELERMGRRLLTALRMFEPGVAMKRAQLRREHPEATEQELKLLVRRWLFTRPGAEHGDAEGKATIYPDAPP
jgi:Rv0078B-related antitoxin